MKRSILSVCKLAAVIFVLAVLSVAAFAASPRVTLDGESYPVSDTELTNETTCLWFRSFMGEMTDGEAAVSWDAETKTASAKVEGLTVTARSGDRYIVANGRYLWCGTENYIVDGRMMVAVRPMAKALGADVLWNGDSFSVAVGKATSPIESGDEFYDADELYWLSRIISAEARGEVLRGQLAVAAVVYNRVEAEEYPDSVYGVIFDMENGVQFTPAATGSVYEEPTEKAVIAAKLAMEGYRYRDDILFFCANYLADSCWAGKNRTFVETIGGHTFFA